MTAHRSNPNPPRPPDYRDRAGRPVVPGDLIARGGEGTVYRCPGLPGQVVKIWKQPREGKGRRKAELMAGLTPPAGDAGYFIAWPTAVAYDGSGRAAGVLMPELPGGGGVWKDAIEVLHPQLRERTAREQGRVGAIEQIDLATAALNYARAAQALHEMGAIVGDINDKNVQVDARNRVAVLDCDSFQVTDGVSGEVYPAPAHRAEFQAPELQGVSVADIRRGIEHDSFALGVLVFKMLCGGEHPFGGRPNEAGIADYTLAERIGEGWNPLERGNRGNLDPGWRARWDELGAELQITLQECLYGPAEHRPSAREIADGGLAPYVRQLIATAMSPPEVAGCGCDRRRQPPPEPEYARKLVLYQTDLCDQFVVEEALATPGTRSVWCSAVMSLPGAMNIKGELENALMSDNILKYERITQRHDNYSLPAPAPRNVVFMLSGSYGTTVQMSFNVERDMRSHPFRNEASVIWQSRPLHRKEADALKYALQDRIWTKSPDDSARAAYMELTALYNVNGNEPAPLPVNWIQSATRAPATGPASTRAPAPTRTRVYAHTSPRPDPPNAWSAILKILTGR